MVQLVSARWLPTEYESEIIHRQKPYRPYQFVVVNPVPKRDLLIYELLGQEMKRGS